MLPVNSIICGDFIDVVKNWPDKCIDLILTDPPYGVRDENWGNEDNFILQIDNWLNECIRLSKTVIWFCAGTMLPYILRNKEKYFHRLLIWNKPEGSQFAGAIHSNLWYSIDPILIFGEFPKTNKTKRFGYACFNYSTVSSHIYNHPTTKPLGLGKDLVYFYSNENDIVLDPFCGSGTFCEASHLLNRKYIGIDISEQYCKISQGRCNLLW